MNLQTSITQRLGIKPNEQKQVVLFFLHNFFIGIGSILIYTSANVILLENHPEFSLPVAYISSAILMMIVGKIYEHYEHQLQLKSLSFKVLVTACILSGLVIIATLFDHSMVMAITIMVCYRVIYLLANLEFWGLSAILFDVRQSKRLFSIIGAGDMPAKMLGAVLAALIHAPSAVPFLMAFALLMFVFAVLTQRKTFEITQISHHSHHAHKKADEEFDLSKLFGRNQLLLRLCLGYALVVTLAIFVEYSFFLNVKHKFHAQHDVTAFIGQILFYTYAIGLVFKLLMSQRFLEKLGVKTALFLLPLLAFILSMILIFLLKNETNDQLLLIYFCAFYLSFEVIRRTVFDPIFLVIFQPLDSQQRLKGHTLAKGFYEPLGIGITGVTLLLFYYFPHLEGWFDYIFVAFLAFLAIVIFNAAYRSYVFTLQSAIKKRFIGSEEFGVRKAASKLYTEALKSKNPLEVQTAIGWLQSFQPTSLKKYIPELLTHPNEEVRLAIFKFASEVNEKIDKTDLKNLIKTEKNEEFKYLLAVQLADSTQLASTDKSIMRGAIVGGLNTGNPAAERALKNLLESSYPNLNLLGLEILNQSKSLDYEPYTEKLLNSNLKEIRQKALELTSPQKALEYINSDDWKSATKAIARAGDLGIELIRNVSSEITSPFRVGWNSRLLRAIEKSTSSKKTDLLIQFTSDFSLRKRVLKDLGNLKVKLSIDKFNQILNSELELVNRIFEGLKNADNQYLSNELDYEINQSIERVFYLLMLNYDRSIVTNAMVGVQHAQKEKRANSFEILENILPHSIYHCLQAILDDSSFENKTKVLGKFLNTQIQNPILVNYILNEGDTIFGDWTISKTLLNYQNTDSESFKKYLNHPKKILKESAIKTAKAMHQLEENQISEIERVIVLKNTPLFKDISENVLSAVAPIMEEVKMNEDEVIFEKNDFGDSMYIIYEGSVAIVDKTTEFTRFGKYDFFGELALLDSEARSASAVAKADSVLFKITQEDFYELLEERPELMRNIIKALSQRIRLQNVKMTTK
jgi:ATP/ADP translocase